MKAVRERLPSEVIKRGYTDEELAQLYELARFSVEIGQLRRAEVILQGLVEVAPDYVPAWLGLCVVHLARKSHDQALQASQHAVRIAPSSLEAMLLLIACLLITGDFTTAGAYLGEVGERLESEMVDNPALNRFYRLQLARYQYR